MFNFLNIYLDNQPIGTGRLKEAALSVIAFSHVVCFFCWNVTKIWSLDAGGFENNSENAASKHKRQVVYKVALLWSGFSTAKLLDSFDEIKPAKN